MIKIILFTVQIIFLLCSVNKLYSQANYFNYHKQINLAEEHIGNEQFSKALNTYDVVFDEYEYAFVKDYLIASQIALLIDSTQKVSHYLEQAIINGYPCKCVEQNPFFKDYISTDYWLELKAREKEYKLAYNSNIRFDLFIEFSKRFKTEQEYKNLETKYYKTTVINNYNRIKSLMDSLIFPSERIIGLDRNIYPPFNNKEFGLSDCDAGNSKVIVTLLHYDNPITDIGIDKFIKAIELGYFHPEEFSTIFFFEKWNHSRLTKNININKANLPNYNFYYDPELHPDIVKKRNLDRAKFGMNTVENRQKLLDVSMKYEFRIKFNYK